MECSKGWTNRCAASKGKTCTCACGGKNHGKDHHHDGKGSPQETLRLSGDVFKFKGIGTCDSYCGVEIMRRGRAATVILTELPDNPGTSVTNAIENIATLIYKERLSDMAADAITWIEHYPQREKIAETHDRVILQWEPSMPHWLGGKIVGTGKFAHPKWMPMKREGVAA